MRRGFTLVELVVTIAIIAVLAALTVYAGIALLTRSETQRTQDMLTVLQTAAQEWEHASERQVTFGVAGQPSAAAAYDVEENQPTEAITRQYLRMLERPVSVKDILKQIDPNLMRRNTSAPATIGPPAPAEGWLEIRDAWDSLIIAVLPGRKHLGASEVSPLFRDVDGTIRTSDEIVFGACASGQLYFVSAGPDGKAGHLHLNVALMNLTPAQKKDIAEAGDNVYSTPPLHTRP